MHSVQRGADSTAIYTNLEGFFTALSVIFLYLSINKFLLAKDAVNPSMGAWLLLPAGDTLPYQKFTNS